MTSVPSLPGYEQYHDGTDASCPYIGRLRLPSGHESTCWHVPPTNATDAALTHALRLGIATYVFNGYPQVHIIGRLANAAMLVSVPLGRWQYMLERTTLKAIEDEPRVSHSIPQHDDRYSGGYSGPSICNALHTTRRRK